MITKQQTILNLISEIRNSHPEMKDIFLNGSCFNLFLIIRTVFPDAKPYVNEQHCVIKVDNLFYDINGVHSNNKKYDEFTDIKHYGKELQKKRWRNFTKK